MDRDAEHYEHVVARLLRTKLAHDDGVQPKILGRRTYLGTSGQKHEIDVSFETVVAGTKVLVLVECKCYKGPVGVDEIKEFAYTLRDIGAQKGIVVTTVGFESGAKRIAQREGIALVVAVKAWHVVSFILAPGSPRYVVFSEDGHWYRHSTGEWKPFKITAEPTADPIVLPARSYQTVPMNADIREKGVAFLPAIDGFAGDPYGIVAAAAVFCIESGIDRAPLERLSDWTEGTTGLEISLFRNG